MLYEDEDEEDFEEFIVYPDDDVSEPLVNISDFAQSLRIWVWQIRAYCKTNTLAAREEEEEDGRTETK